MKFVISSEAEKSAYEPNAVIKIRFHTAFKIKFPHYLTFSSLVCLSSICYNRRVDERGYVEKKRESWDQLSEAVDTVRRGGMASLSNEQLEIFGAQYRAVLSDLAFVRTQCASPDLVRYLNDLAGRARGVLYASHGAQTNGIVKFFFTDFPNLFRETSKYTLTAFLIFLLGCGIAVYMSYSDPDVSRSLMPGEISQHGPGGEKDLYIPDPAGMSSYIMTNNIKVGIVSFAGGVTAGILTVLVILQNGLMLGAVASVGCPQMGAVQFWSLILPHGIIELTAIFVCGGAGLMIASAMIAPGNLKRADAMKIAGGKAVRLLAGTILFYIVAGTIEGFITPSVLPPLIKLAFAGLTAVALILYLGFAGSRNSADECD